MDPLIVLDRLGPGRHLVRVVASPRGWLAAREDLADSLLAAGMGPDGEPRLERIDLIGKRPLEGMAIEGEELVVRRYHHGGLLRWLTREVFRSPRRPFVELCLQHELERHGIHSPEVVAARAVRAWPLGWRLAVATRRVPDALDLGQALGLKRRGELAVPQWRRLVQAAGALVASLHQAGFLHADLTPRNLLVERASLAGEAPKLWVLDLDRSRWLTSLSWPQRVMNVQRLARHMVRMEREHGLAVSRPDAMRFLRAWEGDRSLRHAAWRAIASRTLWTGPVHALGWRLELWLGRGRFGAERHLGSPPS